MYTYIGDLCHANNNIIINICLKHLLVAFLLKPTVECLHPFVTVSFMGRET